MNPAPTGVTEQPDLSTCDREPIHIPGNVQPHGVVLALRESDLVVTQVSASVEPLAGLAPEQVLGKPLESFLTPESFQIVQKRFTSRVLDQVPAYLPPLQLRERAGHWEAILNRYDSVVLLQLEPNAGEGPVASYELYDSLHLAISELSRASSVREFCQIAAEEVRRFTNFDRVMIYQFLNDESGRVIAESRRPGVESFQGLHYPASDIPRQARALYIKSWIRFIVDIDQTPSPLVPALNPETGRPLDLSYAALRSVSPVHVEYLRNMGVRSSLSLSLIRDDKLWGLVACHHDSPKLISHAARVACEFLAHTLSLQMGAKEDSETFEYRTRMDAVRERLVASMAQSEPFYEGLIGPEPNALHALDAGGAALAAGGKITLLGRAPSQQQVEELVQWLAHFTDDEIFATDALPSVHTPAEAYQDSAAGLLGIRLARQKPEFLLWFRPAVEETVTWGGDPAKAMEYSADGSARLSPRKSFAVWRQTVEGRSTPWREWEIAAAVELRRAIVEIVLRRAEELARLNQELKKSNIELDSFAYVASHDLKEPLRGIHNYSQILKRSLGERLQMEEKGRLDTILRLTQRMDDLIESLLQYSRVGRVDLMVKPTNLQELVLQVLDVLRPRLEETHTNATICEPLPTVLCDRVRVGEVFHNLITNAFKYNDKAERVIEIGWRAQGTNPLFYVRDNGIGIEPEHHEDVYRIFKRLHGRDQYGGGTGAGLTIAKKVIERHNGRIWFDSTPGVGTTFYFTLGPGDTEAA